MRTLGILGASGHGKVVAEIAYAAGWKHVVFYDDAWPDKQQVGRWDVRGSLETLLAALDDVDGVVVAIGNNKIRQQKLLQLRAAGANIVTLVHPSAVVSPSARIAAGSVVMAGVVINADVVVGLGAILNTSCSVDHDCVLGDSVHLSPGSRLAGNVSVGGCVWIGIGAVVRQGVHVGESSTVGAGAAVVSDVSEGVTVVGVPAKRLVDT